MKLRIAVLLLSATLCQAQSNFTKGTMTLELYGQFMRDVTGGRANIDAGTVGVGYYVKDHLAVNFELSGFSINQPVRNAAGGGGDILLRHHLIVADSYTLFAEVGGGLFEGTHRVPAGGTHFNFTLQSGLGAARRLRDNLYLVGGLRYFHWSNARIAGNNRNPSLNGAEVYVGILLAI
jgi:hypothetical protein